MNCSHRHNSSCRALRSSGFNRIGRTVKRFFVVRLLSLGRPLPAFCVVGVPYALFRSSAMIPPYAMDLCNTVRKFLFICYSKLLIELYDTKISNVVCNPHVGLGTSLS